MELLKMHARRLTSESEARAGFPKLFDAVFVAIDVEAVNGNKEKLTVRFKTR